MSDLSPQPTPISTSTALDADSDDETVDQKEYRSMISSLLYLTATRPDIQFGVGLCARYQASPRTSHKQVVKRIFRYLKFTPEFISCFGWLFGCRFWRVSAGSQVDFRHLSFSRYIAGFVVPS